MSKSISSNWVMIPISTKDSRKKIRIELTPVYKGVLNRQVHFLIGPRLNIYLARLKSDLPPIILSVLCMVIGFLFIIIQLYYQLRYHEKTHNLIYLGVFLLSIGLWKITDTQFSPLLFPENTVVLGYITLAILFVAEVPLMLFVKGQLQNKLTVLLDISCFISILVAAVVALLQIMGISDLRENILLSHMLIFLAIFSITVSILYHWKKENLDHNTKISFLFFLLCVVGAGMDLVCFYLKGSSSGIFFMIIAVLVYTIFLGIYNIQSINRKAYTDIHTGLFNRSRCNEILSSMKSIQSPTGFIMLDLNQLKNVNDTLGHTAGNQLIFNFANLLHNTVPASEFIGRYGGDEFIIIVHEDEKQRTEKILTDIAAAVKKYNESGTSPKISYAAGYALSKDFTHCNMVDLLRKADQMMYRNKRAWYNEKVKYSNCK